MERPFIIYTLRRTGGTSLTSFMARTSRFQTVEHEPFNRERLWGGITDEVQRGLSGAALRDKIAGILGQTPNIKHCVEVVPMAISRALIDTCASLGYAQFVLHRRDEKARLMSLYLALATGAWGPEEAARIYPKLRSGEVKPAPIELNRVADRVKTDFATLGEVLMRLRAGGIDFGWLIFEDVYATPEATVAAALDIAGRIGLNLTPEDPRLSVFNVRNGQGSGDAFDLVPQAVELMRLLDGLLG